MGQPIIWAWTVMLDLNEEKKANLCWAKKIFMPIGLILNKNNNEKTMLYGPNVH